MKDLEIIFMAIYLFMWENDLAAVACDTGELAGTFAVGALFRHNGDAFPFLTYGQSFPSHLHGIVYSVKLIYTWKLKSAKHSNWVHAINDREMIS